MRHPLQHPARRLRYEAVAPIAAGGTGQVVLARGHEAGLVALKSLREPADDDAAQRLLDEGLLNARVRHENVAQVYEVGMLEGRPFVAMEYVPGVEWAALQHAARRIGAMLSITASTRIALDVALALEAVHNARDASGALLGLVHADVSPRNIVIDDEGRAKLVDFGCASSTRTRTRSASSSTPVGGTFPYVAPERLLGCAASPRSDQFSLGIILWQALTGRRAFRSMEPRELVHARVPRARTLHRHVPLELDRIVARMTSREVGARYPSMHAVVVALMRALPSLDDVVARCEVIADVHALTAHIQAQDQAQDHAQDHAEMRDQTQMQDPSTRSLTVPIRIPAHH